MTTGEIIALAAVVAMVILIEIQLWILKVALQREIKYRKAITRINKDRIVALWEDIRAAGIPRFKMHEESEDDRS